MTIRVPSDYMTTATTKRDETRRDETRRESVETLTTVCTSGATDGPAYDPIERRHERTPAQKYVVTTLGSVKAQVVTTQNCQE